MPGHPLVLVVAIALTAASNDARAQFQGARGACMLFIERALKDEGPQTWIDSDAWQVVSNPDGTVSVGARFVSEGARTGRSRGYTCVLRRVEGGWQLVELARYR